MSSEEPLTDEDGNSLFDDDDDDDDDEGDVLSVAVGFDDETGLVIVNFAKSTGWLGMPVEAAEDFANLILENAKASRESRMS